MCDTGNRREGKGKTVRRRAVLGRDGMEREENGKLRWGRKETRERQPGGAEG